jgi:hypothetical protein
LLAFYTGQISFNAPVSLAGTSFLFKQKPPNKTSGGLAVFQSLRIRLEDP